MYSFDFHREMLAVACENEINFGAGFSGSPVADVVVDALMFIVRLSPTKQNTPHCSISRCWSFNNAGIRCISSTTTHSPVHTCDTRSRNSEGSASRSMNKVSSSKSTKVASGSICRVQVLLPTPLTQRRKKLRSGACASRV